MTSGWNCVPWLAGSGSRSRSPGQTCSRSPHRRPASVRSVQRRTQRRATFVGIPLDASGSGRGDELGTRALRLAGAIETLGLEDAGDLDAHVRSSRRDEASGVISVEAIKRVQAGARLAVREALGAGNLPLLAGGDDAYLPGALAGAREALGEIAMVFFDGHLDACDGCSSPTGEACDMGLASSTGRGPSALMGPLAPVPVIEPGSVWAVGFRDDEEPWVRLPDGHIGQERELLDPAIRLTTAAETRRFGEREMGEKVARELSPGLPVWVHLDLDVLDQAVFPATSYPQPDGLDWDGLQRCALAVVESRPLAGIDVACLNGELDRNGEFARRTVTLLGALLTSLGNRP
jgi:arginase